MSRDNLLYSKMSRLDIKNHTYIALTYFFLAAGLGILLRLFYITPIPGNYKYIIHAHSHTALLGWVYLALTTIIYRLFFQSKKLSKRYRYIFLATNISLLGMLFSFPFQGYAVISIIFSTLFLFCSYFFTAYILKNTPEKHRQTQYFKLIKAALWYMVFSSIGPWALGAIMSTLGKASIWYKLSIYFYLHFQYNAWFLLAIIGIAFYLFQQLKLTFNSREFKRFFYLLNSGVILSFFLSTYWTNPPTIFYVLGGLGTILLLIAFYQLFAFILRNKDQLKAELNSFNYQILKIVGILLLGKIFMQSLTAIPFFADLAFENLDFVIGYLHWVFLGFVSLVLFGFLNWLKLIRLPKNAFYLYLSGFLISEMLIFYKGLVLWLGLPFFSNYFLILVLVSALIPISVGWILGFNLRKK
ncbi:hypothetical protein SAMN05660776_3098 [Salegentibacter holothuriorum]|uniref:Cytochrome C and Quinol oxidase polypeptide I n=2 Tax=Salegentibacter holothuriorum TaxID=241145 RepID=A0A1T5E9J3_9FLAO|nr:hypothetical protein SAMN05660776_3098 [Salegentibacter holothuriorum]